MRDEKKLEWKYRNNIRDCCDKYEEAHKSLRKQFNEELYDIKCDYVKKLENLLRELNYVDTDESEEQS